MTVLWGLALAAPARPEEPVSGRIVRYFEGWYSFVPGSRVTAVETDEVRLPGFATYRVERHSSSKMHQESNVAFYDRARDDLFVGDVFHDPNRAAAGKPLDPVEDLRNIQASLQEAFGVPVHVSLEGRPRGPLQPLKLRIEEQKDAYSERGGFVSTDGATLMLGEFHALTESPAAFRRALLAARPGIRGKKSGSFTVVEFLDFQCERCRKRTPEARLAVWERGGSLETRFLPLVKQHNWAFSAAECGAALAVVPGDLFEKFEESLFARQEGMNEAAARELASDLAESAGVRAAYQAELASGRARSRVLSDMTLAMRLGLTGTPSFIEDGVFISGERDLLEKHLADKLGRSAAGASGGKSR